MSRHPPRLATFSYIGLYRYSLTLCVAERRAVFIEPDPVSEALEVIVRVAASEQFAVTAYCFMPDHLHLLVEGQTDMSNLITFAHQLKQHTEFSYRRRWHRRLWQRGYYEHAVRNDEATLVVARYILANPVRAGLVREPREYPFSGSLVLDRGQLEDLWRVNDAS